MKYKLFKGLCSMRFKCKNINIKKCVPLNPNANSIECDDYEEKKKV